MGLSPGLADLDPSHNRGTELSWSRLSFKRKRGDDKTSPNYNLLGPKMGKSIAYLLFLFVPIAAQEIPDQGNLRTTEARYTLGKYEIVIKHQRAKQAIAEQREDGSAILFWCAAHLEILSKGKVIDRLDFDS